MRSLSKADEKEKRDQHIPFAGRQQLLYQESRGFCDVWLFRQYSALYFSRQASILQAGLDLELW